MVNFFNKVFPTLEFELDAVITLSRSFIKPTIFVIGGIAANIQRVPILPEQHLPTLIKNLLFLKQHYLHLHYIFIFELLIIRPSSIFITYITVVFQLYIISF